MEFKDQEIQLSFSIFLLVSNCVETASICYHDYCFFRLSLDEKDKGTKGRLVIL